MPQDVMHQTRKRARLVELVFIERADAGLIPSEVATGPTVDLRASCGIRRIQLTVEHVSGEIVGEHAGRCPAKKQLTA